ncbi:hypothetical protein [Stigmatella aurantiaca]|uniref:Uncharacterized protein n=1 Tax=Stigmatella aurantiaca (strain DW4/3-1) TaxID=378806 RepID=E3FQ04_STIAD|nr:hypothetical protein [Stigmatella aurantiaca]ADO75707.1 uncharacterized protein STAUR_7952 [Stigmatella aurantiaca DW4/3-1]
MADWNTGPRIIRTGSRYPEAMERVERQLNDELSRGRALTRRQVLRTGGKLLVATVMPVMLTGADGSCPGGGQDVLAYVELLCEALQTVSQVIKGDVKFSDVECRTYQLALDLFTAADVKTGVSVTNGVISFRHCDNESVRRVEEAELVPKQTGDHLVQTQYAGQDWLSNAFSVRG